MSTVRQKLAQQVGPEKGVFVPQKLRELPGQTDRLKIVKGQSRAQESGLQASGFIQRKIATNAQYTAQRSEPIDIKLLISA